MISDYAVDEALDIGLGSDVDLLGRSRAAGGADRRRGLGRALGVEVRGHDLGRSLRGELLGCGPADASGRARDQHHLALRQPADRSHDPGRGRFVGAHRRSMMVTLA